MLKFLQGFMQKNPQVLRAVQGFGSKAAPAAIQQAVDTVTNPQTYRALAGQAERVLQRPLPQAFAGTNFGNIPTRFTGMLTDLIDAPAGLTRNVQTGMVNRAIQEAAGVLPRLSRGVTQTAEGALRAPVIGEALRAGQTVLTNPLQTAIQTGGQFARDPALRREFIKQFGGTSEKAARALSTGAGLNSLGGLFRTSSAFGALPGSNAGKAITAGLLGGGTSIAGTVGNLLFLEGSTPQSADPFDNWQRLGYSSKDDMLQRVSRQAQIENQDRALGSEKYGPPIPGGLKSFVQPGGSPPPGSPLPPPVDPGVQAGQLTPPPAVPPAPGVLSNGAGVPAQRQNVQERALSQEVLNAAQQYAAPAGIPLSSFYQGQQQLGRRMTPEVLQSELKQAGRASGMEDQALLQWVKANPALAYRELQRIKSGTNIQ